LDILAVIIISHKEYHAALNDEQNQERYDSYWKVNGRWSPIGVIESYMNKSFALHESMDAFCVLLERIGVILKTQADTERVVKVIRKVEGRFSNYNEVREAKGKRDRANQEIFLHENSVSLADVPLEDLNQLWLKTHLSSVKKSGKGKQVCINNCMENDVSTAKFLAS
jgi:hypothetical protein